MPGCGLCALSWSRGARNGGRGRRRRSRVGGHLVHHRVAVGVAAVDVGGQRRTAVGLLGAQHQQAQQPEAPSSTFKGGHKHAMREVISSPKPRPQRSSHLHIRTKRTRHSSCPRAITRTDGAAPRPSERLAARGTAFRPKYQIWGGPHQIWGGPPQTERLRTQRYTALRHPTYARASSGDQWPSLAIPTQSAPISGPHSQSRRNRRQSVAFTRNPDAISGALDAPVLN